MPHIADPDDAVLTAEILTAVLPQFQKGASVKDNSHPPAIALTDERARREVEHLRDLIMAALAAERARREQQRVPPGEDRVLTAAEAAKQLGLSRFTMLRMRRSPDAGGLPFVRLSQGRIGYRGRDIEAYLLARRVGRLPDKPTPPQEGQPHPQLTPEVPGRKGDHSKPRSIFQR